MDDSGREVVAAVAGGVGGSVLVAALERVGMAPRPAAVGVAIAGGLGALVLEGGARAAALGAAAASVGRLVLMWMEERSVGASRREQGGIAGEVERARRQLAREEEKRAVAIEVPAADGAAGGRDEDVGGGEGGVAVSEHEGGGGVSEVPVGVGDQECGGKGRAEAERDRGEGIAPVHEGGAASLCDGEGGALRSQVEWEAWRERGA